MNNLATSLPAAVGGAPQHPAHMEPVLLCSHKGKNLSGRAKVSWNPAKVWWDQPAGKGQLDRSSTWCLGHWNHIEKHWTNLPPIKCPKFSQGLCSKIHFTLFLYPCIVLQVLASERAMAGALMQNRHFPGISGCLLELGALIHDFLCDFTTRHDFTSYWSEGTLKTI